MGTVLCGSVLPPMCTGWPLGFTAPSCAAGTPEVSVLSLVVRGASCTGWLARLMRLMVCTRATSRRCINSRRISPHKELTAPVCCFVAAEPKLCLTGMPTSLGETSRKTDQAYLRWWSGADGVLDYFSSILADSLGAALLPSLAIQGQAGGLHSSDEIAEAAKRRPGRYGRHRVCRQVRHVL